MEPIEVGLRTKLSYHHAHKYGSEGYKLAENFERTDFHTRFMVEFQKAIDNNSRNLFVKHHLETYGGHFPLWVASELFTFGMLSKFYANMKPQDRKIFAKRFRTSPDHLKSWLACLTELRNRCAHYMRLYFVRLVFSPRLPKQGYRKLSGYVFDDIYILKQLQVTETQQRRWESEFIRPLEALVETYQDSIELQNLGFPPHWVELLES